MPTVVVLLMVGCVQALRNQPLIFTSLASRGQVWANLDVAHKGADAAASDQLTNLERELSLIRAGIDRGLGILLEDSKRLCAQIDAYVASQAKS